jgi:hypothetical protein
VCRKSSTGPLTLYTVYSPLQTPLTDLLPIRSGYPARLAGHPSPPQIGSTTAPPANQALSLPPSFFFAGELAGVQVSSASAAPTPAAPLPVPVVHQPDDSQRHKLADLLYHYLQTNPEPTIGSQENPFPWADPLGIRGCSILSALFETTDMETFMCTFCGDRQMSIEAALAHQQRFLKTCKDFKHRP